MSATAHELLDELRRRGAVAFRVGDRLRVRPADVVPPELVDRLRAHKAELLGLVAEHPPAAPAVDYEAIYAALTAAARTADDLAAIDRHADLNGFWVSEEIVWLDRRCDALAQAGGDEASYRAAIALL